MNGSFFTVRRNIKYILISRYKSAAFVDKNLATLAKNALVNKISEEKRSQEPESLPVENPTVPASTDTWDRVFSQNNSDSDGEGLLKFNMLSRDFGRDQIASENKREI